MGRAVSRMYVRVYAALLGSLVVATILFGVIWIYFSPTEANRMELLGQVAVQALAPPDAPPEEQQEALMRWRGRGLFAQDEPAHAPAAGGNGGTAPADATRPPAPDARTGVAAADHAGATGHGGRQRPLANRWRGRLRGELALYDANHQILAAIGRPLPPLSRLQTYSGPMINATGVYAIHLSDGRWLLVRRGPLPQQMSAAIIVLLLLTAVVVAIGAYPVVRRITGRLERLQDRVQAWGRGDLSTRVAVEGTDEVARLATSFNESAARIDALMRAQKSLLANASHELRSPLARIRMAVELVGDGAPVAIRDELKQNIAELDQLIDEVLLASRLDATPEQAGVDEAVDFSGLAAEEAARVNAHADLQTVTVRGDARLLRRLVRNLLENGQRYGGSDPLHVTLAVLDSEVQLDVCDRGPGVPEAERERIFEPFYRATGASETSGGVGLGLALVRQIAQRHHGRAVCLPREGGGTCFRVTLPRI